MLVAVVFPAEAHGTVVDRQDALVGDGHAVGVAAEVVEHAGGAREGGLGIDDPLAATQRPEVAVEGSGVSERSEGAAEAQAVVAESPLEFGQEDGPEAAREDADGEEEAGPASDPAVTGRGGAAAGDDAVQMGMVAEIRAPGVQDSEEADLGTEVPGIGGDLAHGTGGGAEEQRIQLTAVLQRDRSDGGGEGEDDMEVLAIQQFAAAAG